MLSVCTKAPSISSHCKVRAIASKESSSEALNKH